MECRLRRIENVIGSDEFSVVVYCYFTQLEETFSVVRENVFGGVAWEIHRFNTENFARYSYTQNDLNRPPQRLMARCARKEEENDIMEWCGKVPIMSGDAEFVHAQAMVQFRRFLEGAKDFVRKQYLQHSDMLEVKKTPYTVSISLRGPNVGHRSGQYRRLAVNCRPVDHGDTKTCQPGASLFINSFIIFPRNKEGTIPQIGLIDIEDPHILRMIRGIADAIF